MNKIDFTKDWFFKDEKVEIASIHLSEFQRINLPHTWNRLDGEDGEDDYKRVTSTYVKHFQYKNINKRVFIEFEGSNSITHVYINKIFLGTHEGGYSRFRFEITDNIKESNELIVYVDNRHYDHIYPLTADFTFFGGIYRKLNLIETDVISFDLTHKGAEGVYVSQVDISEDKAVLQIDAYLDPKIQQEQTIELISTLKDHLNNTITKHHISQTINGKTKITHNLIIDQPHLWQGISDPYLYQLWVELYVGNDKIDERIIPTGLRFFHVDENTFYLNGKPYKLYGVCRHQDREHLGNALTDDMHIEDMELIKDIGANAVRLAHYQQADIIYQLADQMGFIVWAEIPYISRTSATDLSGSNALSQMEELIKQNYNHSSICMWGIGNEITLRGERVSSNEIYDSLNKLTKHIDPYRLSTIAQLANVSFDDYHNNITDLIGYNLYYGWYVGKASDLSDWLKNYRKSRPHQSVCLSEYGAEGIINIHSENPKPWDYSEEYHAWYHETIYEIIEQTPFIWGSFVWNMFTFASDARAEGNTKGINNKGLVSHDRKTKKDAFFYYQAKWSHHPMIHLTSKRFRERLRQDIELKVYSNQTYVDFYCNQTFLGKVISQNGVFKMPLKLKEGTNHIKVISNDLLDETVFIYQKQKKMD